MHGTLHKLSVPEHASMTAWVMCASWSLLQHDDMVRESVVGEEINYPYIYSYNIISIN